MPTISIFYGIVIRMFAKDHAPPHFHAIYAEHEALISIASGAIIEGKLPRSARRLVKEWARENQNLLMQNWENAQRGEPLERIAGLDATQGD